MLLYNYFLKQNKKSQLMNFIECIQPQPDFLDVEIDRLFLPKMPSPQVLLSIPTNEETKDMPSTIFSDYSGSLFYSTMVGSQSFASISEQIDQSAGSQSLSISSMDYCDQSDSNENPLNSIHLDSNLNELNLDSSSSDRHLSLLDISDISHDNSHLQDLNFDP